MVEPLAGRPQRGVKPLGRGVRRSSDRSRDVRGGRRSEEESSVGRAARAGSTTDHDARRLGEGGLEAARARSAASLGAARVTFATDYDARRLCGGRPGNRSDEECGVARCRSREARDQRRPCGHVAIVRISPQCSHSLQQPNVGLSCEPRKQAERPKDALRRAGV